MIANLTQTIKELQQEKGINPDLILKIVEKSMTKAYEKYYGTTENLVIRHEDDYILSIMSKKEVVEEIEDDLFEIDLVSAKKINKDAEIGDDMLVPCNPEEFGRIAVHTAKQVFFQAIKEIEKNSQYSEFKEKEGELVIGYIQRIKNDSIFVNLGDYEGVILKRGQAPHENYQVGDRIKAYVEEVAQNKKGFLSIILSRSSEDFVKKLLELEIPEILDQTVNIYKIVREPGYRTKIAVYSNKEEIDPVGSCVGKKGDRILVIIKELEGEKIDVLKWTIDIRKFIENAMIPARVEDVVIIDEPNRKAIVVVDESQFSFAVGKKGTNIKLVNKLTGWNIEVKTIEQAKEMNIITDHVKRAEELFKNNIDNEFEDLEIPSNIKNILFQNNIYAIQDIIEMSVEELKKIQGMSDDMAEYLKGFMDENFELIVEEDNETEAYEEDGEEHDGVVYFECPNCGSNITEDATSCPNCGVEIAFEEEEETD